MNICKQCKKPFTPYRKTVKYCSHQCSRRAYVLQHPYKPRPKVPIKCKNCGEEVLPKIRTRQYCNDICKAQYYTKHFPEKRAELAFHWRKNNPQKAKDNDQRPNLGWQRAKNRMFRWTVQEEQFLLNNQHLKIHILKNTLNRSYGSIKRKLYDLNLKKL